MKIFSMCLALVFLSSCAALHEMQLRSEERHRELYCSYDGAYTLGVNQAISGQSMDPTIARLCSEEVKADVQRGYREGFMSERSNRPTVFNFGNNKK